MISIIHPSRGRPQMALDTKIKWLNRADVPQNIEYRLVCDKDDPELFRYQYQNGSFTKDVLVCDNKNTSCVDAINYGALHSNHNLIVVVSDDFDCPEGWDTLLLEATAGKEDFCLKTTDSYQPFIITLPIMDRKYYNRFGYVYNPSYLHMFCDSEMSCVAWLLGKYLQVDLPFTHNHYSIGTAKGGIEKDAISIKNDATWNQGKAVFKLRYRDNFGITPVQELPEYSGFPAYMKTI